MRNGGCVAGHSIHAAFHHRGPAAVSPHVYLLEQTTGRLPTGSASRTHTHTLPNLVIWDSNCARAQRTGQIHTHATSINVYAGTHKHAVTPSRR